MEAGRPDLKIAAVAERAGVLAKAIRYREEVGLMAPAERGANGYRVYAQRDVGILRCIRQARSLGFSVRDMSNLLSLWADQERASADVKAVARKHLDEVEIQTKQIESVCGTRLHLTERCRGSKRPDWLILGRLAEDHQCH